VYPNGYAGGAEVDTIWGNGLAFVTMFFVAACVLGMLWKKDPEQQIKAIGDRIACGLFALPLVSICVQRAFPNASRAWILLAPLPLAIYVILLALSDTEPEKRPKFIAHFSRILVVAILLVYAFMAQYYALS
jgi:hypothetical protein